MNTSWLSDSFVDQTGKVLGGLKPHADVLRRMIGSTEKEFLEIGEKLQQFHARAGAMSDDASGVAKKMSGREMDGIRRGFGDMLSWIENLSGGMQSEKENLRVMLDHFDGLNRPMEEFEKIARILKVLCNFIKIETARLGLQDTSFQKLSEDVEQMSGMIGGKIAALMDQAQDAIPSLLNNVSLIENSHIRQQASRKQILAGVEGDLDAISAKYEESSRVVQDISDTWRHISNNVGEVVQSLQFHDITRQRVQHVLEILEELPHKLHGSNGSGHSGSSSGENGSRLKSIMAFPAGRRHRGEWVADTFRLQAAQLQGALRDFNKAVEHILTSLHFVSEDATVITEKVGSMTGMTGGNASESFILKLENSIGRLTASADEMIRIKKELAQTMSVMSKTAAGMSAFTKDMEIIGIEMQRLALNARVHAAHLGDRGASLGVLADSIHQMSQNTSSRVSEMIGHLQAVGEYASHLAEMADVEGGEIRTGGKNIGEHFLDMSSPLKKIESDMEALLPQIEKSASALSDGIEHLIAGVRVHETVSADLDGVALYLNASAEKVGAAKARGLARKKSGLPAYVFEKYTMHRERQTHNDSMGDILDPPKPVLIYAAENQIDEPDAAVRRANAASDLGDNVELF